jgi:hypothetical protein
LSRKGYCCCCCTIAIPAVDLVAKLRELHRPFGIHDECDCEWEDELGDYKHPDGATVVNCPEYVTCEPAMWFVCARCCRTDDGDCYQLEVCADTHDHGPGKPICETGALLDLLTAAPALADLLALTPAELAAAHLAVPAAAGPYVTAAYKRGRYDSYAKIRDQLTQVAAELDNAGDSRSGMWVRSMLAALLDNEMDRQEAIAANAAVAGSCPASQDGGFVNGPLYTSTRPQIDAGLRPDTHARALAEARLRRSGGGHERGLPAHWRRGALSISVCHA